jgi:hypothetical protein
MTGTLKIKSKRNMKIYQLTILICLCLLQNIVFAQTGKIDGTYQWDMTEYLTITGDSFKLHLYPIAWSLYGLNREDTILAEGNVQYESDNFIKLISKNYERKAEKNMTVIESVDSCLNDSIRFNFIFPFDGKYKITLYFEGNHKNKVEVKNRKEIVLPAYRDSILMFSFYILNQTPAESSYYNYLKKLDLVVFLIP